MGIRLFLKPSSYKAFETKFAKYHYMDRTIPVSTKCFTVWARFGFVDEMDTMDTMDGVNGLECVGFISIVHTPFGNKMAEDVRHQWRECRTVILPPYQSMGFGSRACDAV